MKQHTNRASSDHLSFLSGSGEMIELMRQKNWSKTVVGSPEFWPQSLRTTLGIILENKFPMFLWWGPDLICFYNDAYRPSLGIDGKHPNILGERAKEYWAEIWDIIYPLIKSVKETGEAYWSEDQLVPIYRNGSIENVYWTFSYSPVRDESHEIGGILVTCNETTNKVNSLKQLRESEDQLSFAIDAAELGTWDYNPITNKFIGNDRLKDWFGLERKTALDLSHVTNAIIDEDRDYVISEVKKALDPINGGNHEVQYTIQNRKSGNKRIVRAKGKGWFENNKLYRFNGTLQDVTIQATEHSEFLKQTNDTLQKYISELEKSNAELQSFAYVSSHDLQEPLRKITTFISRIEEREKLSTKDKEDFERIRVSAQRMRQLINDLLNYSRINDKSITKEPTEISEIVNQVLDDLNERIKSKNATIQVGALKVLNVIPYQFRQLFNNLISNSLKFSQPDIPLEIKISGEEITESDPFLKDADQRHLYYKISVSDNGIGFSQDQSELIFKMFQKLHNKSDYKGTGIGLAIVNKIIREHDGFIRAIGEKGKGATFEIYIPV